MSGTAAPTVIALGSAAAQYVTIPTTRSSSATYPRQLPPSAIVATTVLPSATSPATSTPATPASTVSSLPARSATAAAEEWLLAPPDGAADVAFNASSLDINLINGKQELVSEFANQEPSLAKLIADEE
jgi:hypothetical protein